LKTVVKPAPDVYTRKIVSFWLRSTIHIPDSLRPKNASNGVNFDIMCRRLCHCAKILSKLVTLSPVDVISVRDDVRITQNILNFPRLWIVGAELCCVIARYQYKTMIRAFRNHQRIGRFAFLSNQRHCISCSAINLRIPCQRAGIQMLPLALSGQVLPNRISSRMRPGSVGHAHVTNEAFSDLGSGIAYWIDDLSTCGHQLIHYGGRDSHHMKCGTLCTYEQ
jgi:hypothetical protein